MARELFEDKSRTNMAAAASSVGFCYSDVSSATNPATIQTHLTQIQANTGFDHHQSNNSAENIFNLTTGMEMIGFSKNHHHQSTTTDNSSNSVMWKSFFSNKNQQPGPSSSSKPSNNESTSDFYQTHHHQQHQDQFNTTGISDSTSDLMDQSAWQVDDSSLRCVFPCEGNERPSQGLSLSLSSTNPSSIGLQSFELRQTSSTQDHDHMRFVNAAAAAGRNGFFGKSLNNNLQQHEQMMGTTDENMMMSFHLRNSKYLAPAQELLNEFCSLGTKQSDSQRQKNKQLEDVVENNGSTSSSSRNKQPQQQQSSLFSLDIIELQKRKAKLLSMLEEVDRRYRHYCDQMKAVVSNFEAVAGNGAATVYSALASKAMSRHFRCLRDGIVGQIQATKKAMGEKDPVAPGTSRGETPRLRLLDQTLRQQRAFQQMTMMESHPWRPQRGLPERSVSVLRAWLFEHFLHPYPSDVDKHILARQTGLSRSQVSNWFINARVRLWKPMVEEMYIEETKEQVNIDNNMGIGGGGGGGASSDGITTDPDDSGGIGGGGGGGGGRPNPNTNNIIQESDDHKPTPDQLVRIDSECLSSIISNPDKDSKYNKPIQTDHNLQHSYGAYNPAMELDFSSYNHNSGGFGHHDHHFNGGVGGGGGGGVSLTLGLQQHGNNGVSLAFSPASQNSLFYPRDHHHHHNQHELEDCQPVVQYSLLDGDQGQNLPYRNLMGAQLLHDLAG